MSYYDNVKDNVQGKGGDDDSSNQFESLKEAAEETSNEPDEEKGDDTPIEVLEEDGLSETAPSKQRKKSQSSGGQERSRGKERSQSQASRKSSRSTSKSDNASQSQSSGNPMTGSHSSAGANNDFSGLEEKLDRIIEQNERMIEILESFGS